VTDHRIDGQNAVVPPSRPTVTYPSRILPKHALGISITVNLFQITVNLFQLAPYEGVTFGSLMAVRAAVDRPE
jgi:hypothetical protein